MHHQSDKCSDPESTRSLTREALNVTRFCLLILVVFSGLVIVYGKPPPSGNLPMLSKRPPRGAIPGPTPKIIIRTNQLPPLPGQTNGKTVVTTNSFAVVILGAQAAQPVLGVKRFAFTTSTPIPGMTISNNLQATTNLKSGPWTNLLWMTANGQSVTVDIKIDPKLPGKFFRMGTNTYGP